MARDELLFQGVRDRGEGEGIVLFTEQRVKDDLTEQVTELLFEVSGGAVGPRRVDAHVGLERVDHFVRLFE